MSDPMSDVPEVSDNAFNDPTATFDDEAAGRLPEWERMIADIGEDTGDPDPVLGLLYSSNSGATTAPDSDLEPEVP